MTEQWRAIPGWDGLYECSDRGRIRSSDRVVPRKDGSQLPVRGRVLRTPLNSGGYPQTVLTDRSGTRASTPVHVAVALTFLGPRPAGAEVCHADDVKTNNTVENLRYGSRSDNSNDRVRNGRSTIRRARRTVPRVTFTTTQTRISGLALATA